MTEWTSTTCMRCAVGCGHVQRGVDVGHGLDTVRGDPAHPVNRGLACQRGVRETADPDGEWLAKPLVRRDGELRKTTWDLALARIVERFGRILERNRDGIAVLGSGQQTNEAAYALGKLARGGFGTRYYDANTTLCMASAVTAYYDAFGSDAPPPTYDDVPEADTHVVWGANPAVAHPVMFRWIADSAGGDDGELIVVDPVETETAAVADAHVALEPGGDLDLARAVLARAVETGRVDEAFVDEATAGFEELRADLPDPETAAERAGVDAEVVETLAAAFEEPTLVYWGMGVNQSTQGTDTAGALIDLCLATGNLGPGSGPFSLTGQANSMGTRVCSSKGTWPGHRDFGDADARATVADAWDVPVERLPDDSGPGPVGTLDAVADGPVEAVYAVATNPVAGMPDASDAAAKLDDAFLVVQDTFRTETTELADVVLPAATWGESDGTAMNMERTVSRVRPATDLPSGIRTDLDIVTTVGDALVDGLFGENTDPKSVFAEFAALTAGTPADCSGIGYDRLDAELAVRWPAPDAEVSGGYRYHHDGEWSFPTPSGRARFAGGTGRELPEPPDEEYPLTLTTAREADGYNTGVRSRESPDDPGDLVARIHPDTVAAHLADTGENDLGENDSGETDSVSVESRRGSVRARIEVDEAVRPGLVWLPVHHPATNELTVPATDPRSDEPNFKQCAVRLVAAREAVAVETAGSELA
ncbi:assimilatory nitrate reductase NasA [Halorussus rarus]|uniref:assimilatory nitrate reductase NasA n=1 Tax=Halorussus TaxID=1070314 RepID=UPI000E213E92|nr:assimilatory nitrate reductase NasA [Halorussus rarus]NHN58355.1 molybdopterin oxidoreductase family protein [Halorussus sp. JP-T4]